MSRLVTSAVGPRSSVGLALRALRSWGAAQVLTAAVAAVAVAVVIGVATVLIPNPVFGREIAPVAWNYPVWILTSILMGMLIATYVRPLGVARRGTTADSGTEDSGTEDFGTVDSGDTDGSRRGARAGTVGGVLAWFAVGCPVCNKIALLALGYSGALTWFAPFQPVLAVAALVLCGAAVMWRLRGQVYCPAPSRVTMTG